MSDFSYPSDSTKSINLLFLGANSSIYIAVAIPIGKESIKVMLSAKSEPINAPKIPDCSDSDESPLVKKVLLKNLSIRFFDSKNSIHFNSSLSILL